MEKTLKHPQNSVAKKLHTVLTPRQDSEVRRIVHVICGEAFGLSKAEVVNLGEVSTERLYTATLNNHLELISALVSTVRTLQTNKNMQLRRVLNKELQKELENRNSKVLEILDNRLYGDACETCGRSAEEDKQWVAAVEMLKRAAPVKTIQKHEGDSTQTVYHIPVGVAQRRLPQKQRKIEAPDAIEAEVVQ